VKETIFGYQKHVMYEKGNPKPVRSYWLKETNQKREMCHLCTPYY